MVGSDYMGLDVGHMAAGQGSQRHDGDEAQSSTAYPSEGVHLHQDMGDSAGSMEHDQRAMAPAHEAPRAP